ncbi:DMT family transporter [Kordiimonas aquimaris]|uniref:DMT family transporter n=1 Tax=Kordiimonas aquimaris TaxID=707591 RepID=UPI0021D1491B|nr:DMT family transporter [Kordiimonas aquimaris]
MTPSTITFTVLMFVAGIGIPVMAAMNAGLGVRIASPVGAVFILSGIAVIVSGTAMLFVGVPEWAAVFSAPPKYYFGGLFFLFYILSVTVAAPRIGLGNAVFYVLLGQLVAAAVIDHYGILSAAVSEITPRRVLGLVVMAVGVFLARKDMLPTNMGAG